MTMKPFLFQVKAKVRLITTLVASTVQIQHECNEDGVEVRSSREARAEK